MTVPSTPCLVIDETVVQRNLKRLADYGRQHKLGIRPHTKTHKSKRMARLQLDHGAVGLTVAKVGEAEVMAEVGSDLLLAYPALDPARTERITRLAQRVRVSVAVDSIEAIDALASAARSVGATVGILADLDVGFHRTGVPTPADALKLAQHVTRTTGVELRGLFLYPGHVWLPGSDQVPALQAVAAMVGETLDLWRHSGIEAGIVSAGSTPTALMSHHIPQLTEIRPGTYIYNDMNTVRGGYCSLDDCAARIVCTVVSTAVANKAILDAGSKTLTSDRNATQPDSGFGHVVEYPHAPIIRLSEEHGELDLTRSPRKPKLGERVTVIPNHICPCVNLQDSAMLLKPDGSLEPLTIDARGKLS